MFTDTSVLPFSSNHLSTKKWRSRVGQGGFRALWGCGGVGWGGGRFDWRLCFSITDRKSMTQLMTHTFKCPPKYTAVFYSVCTEVEKLIKLVFIFRLFCNNMNFQEMFKRFLLKDEDKYKFISPSAQVIIYGYYSLQFLSAKLFLFFN